jgi:hypothetical protein
VTNTPKLSNQVVIAMLLQIASKKRVKPEKILEDLIQTEYQRLK